MEDFDGNNVVTARWLHYTAVKAAEGEWDGSSGALLKILRIVQ
jgi:hypothetical protein